MNHEVQAFFDIFVGLNYVDLLLGSSGKVVWFVLYLFELDVYPLDDLDLHDLFILVAI